ncbi:HD domain-containing protein [Filobacillus milosensis]|uniref:HD domain-containing protein n=1 Tax=Filobacillus milosensis TaxID=94137 RepID=A0A4Y8ICN4_9BACI|nr:HD domain-containing phosphohydrolase [Filobacillus milosensis]TFB13675.1 HD domain-containing protein [Filobacillus milosensis]
MTKMLNWYTLTLTIIACVTPIFSIYKIWESTQDYFLYLFMLLVIVILENLPIKMPTGQRYIISGLLVLLVSINFGLEFGLLAIAISTYTLFVIHVHHRSLRINYFRYFVTIGMYFISLTLALLTWSLLNNISMILAVAAVVLVYEVSNLILLEGIFKTVYNEKMFTKWKEYTTETILPVIVGSVVIPRILILEDHLDIYISVLYTLFFLLVIVFFSRYLTQQIELRKNSSQSFISVLEKNISPTLTGHGNRVASIVEMLLDEFEYPKGKRSDLIHAAITHDIGKSVLPPHIFRKRGALTISEEREYETHPEKAVDLVKSMFPKESFTEWILYHHERWDGQGFPKGLKEEDIPRESRILALCNELEHLLSRHDDNETVLELLKDLSGTILDPTLVKKIELYHIEMVREVFKQYKTGENHTRSNKRTGQVESPSDHAEGFGESFFIQVNDGVISSGGHNISLDFLQSLSDKSLEYQRPVHETYQSGHSKYDIHAQPLENGDVTLFVHDLTPFVNYRIKLEQKILESYEQVVNTLSNEKIRLHSSVEGIQKQLGEYIDETPIKNSSDIPRSRQFMSLIQNDYPTNISSMKAQVAVTETVTNIIKHATSGKLQVFCKEDRLQYLISDKGSGIPLHEIPKTILVSGYSSKISLGKGFNMIANFSDRVQLYTSSEGTHILLEYRLQQDDKQTKSNDAS